MSKLRSESTIFAFVVWAILFGFILHSVYKGLTTLQNIPKIDFRDIKQKEEGNHITLPDERYRSVRSAREFLRDLLDPKKTPRVPRSVRNRAYSILKHYPTSLDMSIVANEMQGVFDIDGKEQFQINVLSSILFLVQMGKDRLGSFCIEALLCQREEVGHSDPINLQE